jgi:phosphomannomutase
VDVPDLATRTRDWIAGDPDPATRAELEEVLAAGDTAELAERMAGSLQFGTAGLRGKVEAGSNRMNRAVVIRTTRGIVDYLRARDGAGRGLIVVGRDARLSSERLMQDTVGVLAAAGLEVRYFADVTPTPVVAFAARTLGARMAIVVTASHNPPWDNGYKVYDGNGVQIVPPVDGDIAAAITAVGSASSVPRIGRPYEDQLETVKPTGPAIFGRYLDEIAASRTSPSERRLRIVHTPLHGVGGRFVTDALSRLGGHTVIPVTEQFEPDGRFPTVEFPNPEEPGALDLALAAAAAEDADVVIANDPDTDRLAVAIPDDPGWRRLTGNQIGVLLADHVLRGSAVENALAISSIVSSPMLGSIATAHGGVHVSTLTGFKWIWNAALDLEESGAGTFVFGFEEALGYSVSRAARDKDGISAAVVFADLVAATLDRDMTMLEALGELYARHGLWSSIQRSVVRRGTEGAAEITAAVDRAASDPPPSLGGDMVVAVTDYRRGAEARPRYLGAADLVEFSLASGGRVLVRPSGTEPKLKIYVDLRIEVAPNEDWRGADEALVARAAKAASELIRLLGLGAEDGT